MRKRSLWIKQEDELKKYTSVTCVCIYPDYHWDPQNIINEPVLYFQQRRKTKHGETCKETAIPLSKIIHMSY